jgi:hypothetical protein
MSTHPDGFDLHLSFDNRSRTVHGHAFEGGQVSVGDERAPHGLEGLEVARIAQIQRELQQLREVTASAAGNVTQAFERGPRLGREPATRLDPLEPLNDSASMARQVTSAAHEAPVRGLPHHSRVEDEGIDPDGSRRSEGGRHGPRHDPATAGTPASGCQLDLYAAATVPDFIEPTDRQRGTVAREHVPVHTMED